MRPTVYHKSLPKRGFTLVEALVCVAVIGALLVICIPVLSGMRQSASQAQCLARLRECGQAVLLHANDRMGAVESTTGGKIANGFWANLLFQRGYIADKRIFRCPTGQASIALDNAAWMWRTYGMNMQTTPFATISGADFRLYIRRAERPSEHPLLMDSATKSLQQSFRIEVSGEGFGCRHFKKANTFFLDGHISSVDAETAKEVYDITAFVE